MLEVSLAILAIVVSLLLALAAISGAVFGYLHLRNEGLPPLADVSIIEEIRNGQPVFRFLFDTEQEFLIPVAYIAQLIAAPDDGETDAVAHHSIGFIPLSEEED